MNKVWMERKMTRRLFLTFSLLALAPVTLWVTSPSKVVAEEQYEEGTHYELINPAVRTANPDTIEVAEFFWYGCGHCYTFEPMLMQWKKTLAEDVDFQGSPAIWNAKMELHARAFYTAQALGVLDRLVEDAIREEAEESLAGERARPAPPRACDSCGRCAWREEAALRVHERLCARRYQRVWEAAQAYAPAASKRLERAGK